MKKIFLTDLLMVIFSILSAFTGIKIHYANDFQTHEICHTWSVIHVLTNIALLIVAIKHIKQHWGWYKSLFKKNNLANKSKITILTTIIFAVTVITGTLLLLFINGQKSSMGFAHYIIGLLFGAMGLLHFIKRWKLFKKGIIK